MINCSLGGMAEWSKAAVLKTAFAPGERGFESYSLRHPYRGEMTESAEGARLLSECWGKLQPRVRIPLSPPLLPQYSYFSLPVTNSFRILIAADCFKLSYSGN